MEPTEQDVQAAVDAAETPLDDMDPVQVEEVDDDGESPPESWGQNGEGVDNPTDALPTTPQEADQA